jgi:hypothetical protein
MRLLIWLAAAALLVVGAAWLARVYETLPSAQADIILSSAILAAVAVFVVIGLAVMVHEWREDRRYREIGDDVEAYLAPLRAGSRSAERAMFRFHREHGLLLLRRTSDATRRFAAAVDARRPRRFRRPMRRPVWTVPVPAPVEEEALVPLPEPPAAPDPDLHAAPLPEEILPPAAADGGTSPIGDALAAELGTVPEPPPLRADEDNLACDYGPDSTMWGRMRDELFAMLDEPATDVEVAS